MAITVSDLAIAPVKGLRLAQADALEIGESGAVGDRAFVVVDENDCALMQTARIPHSSRLAQRWDPGSGELMLCLPDGAEVSGVPTPGKPAGTGLYDGRRANGRLVSGPHSEALSAHLGRPVRLLALDRDGSFSTRRVSSGLAIGRAQIERDTGRVMSQENLGLARNAVAAFNRRDVPALVEMVTEDFQWVTWTGTVQSTAYHGADGLASYFRDSDVWEVLNLEAQEFRDLGAEVLVVGTFHARGGGSGVEIHAPYYSAFFMTDGKLARVLSFRTETEALEAVALREQAMSRENVDPVWTRRAARAIGVGKRSF